MSISSAVAARFRPGQNSCPSGFAGVARRTAVEPLDVGPRSAVVDHRLGAPGVELGVGGSATGCRVATTPQGRRRPGRSVRDQGIRQPFPSGRPASTAEARAAGLTNRAPIRAPVRDRITASSGGPVHGKVDRAARRQGCRTGHQRRAATSNSAGRRRRSGTPEAHRGAAIQGGQEHRRPAPWHPLRRMGCTGGHRVMPAS